ncbi:MAG: glycosyltransferase, partial [Gaiellaceae bacterium]
AGTPHHARRGERHLGLSAVARDSAPGVSLIATVLNEADSVEAWLSTVLSQTRPPDEIVIVDAGSEDGTLEILHRTAASCKTQLRVIVVPGVNISEGRNRAIAEAKGQIIAASDAGTVLEPDWLERLLLAFRDPEVDVVSGFYKPDGRSNLERVLARVITPRLDEIDPVTFLPSSRSIAYKRSAWERAGGYPEWLRVCEDVVFDLKMRDDGARFAMAPDAIVSWFPAPTLRAYFRQWKRYARGDGHAHLFGRRHAVRYAAYLSGIGLSALGRNRSWPIIALAVGSAAYLRKFTRRLWGDRPLDSIPRMLAATLLMPVIVVVGDVAKMIGYPLGRWERWRAGSPSGLERASILPHRSLRELDDAGRRIRVG